MVNKWKITAIISITLLVLSWGGVAYIMYEGWEDYDLKTMCMLDTCVNYEAYNYDMRTNLCTCYVDGMPRHSKVL